MIQKSDILFGIIFVLIMVASVSAQYDWASYGNFNLNAQAQSKSAFGNFNGTFNNITSPVGYSVPYTNRNYASLQPLQVDLSGDLYLLNNDTIEVLNSGLVVLNSTFTGAGTTQIAVLDFNSDSLPDIAGIYSYNSSLSSLRIFSYNYHLNSFSEIYQQNFSFPSGSVTTGIKNSGKNIYLVNSIFNSANNYTAIFYKINITQSINATLGNFNNSFNEPISLGDFNADSITEFMTYSIKNIIIFNSTNLINNITIDPNYDILSAKMFLPDSTNIYKVSYLKGRGTSTDLTLFTAYMNGTTNYSVANIIGAGSGGWNSSQLAISSDIDGDGKNDIVICGGNYIDSGTKSVRWQFKSVKGNTGATIYSSATNPIQHTVDSTNITINYQSSCTIADLDNDGYEDMMATYGKSLIFYNLKNNSLMYNLTSNFYRSCIPADLNVDGFQEIICSGENGTIVFSGNSATNQNANIVSVDYNPDVSIQVNTNLYATINAIDPESDSPLFYNIQCNGTTWGTENTNPVQNCFFSDVGTYNVVVGVRDPYHTNYTIFSQNIIVTPTSFMCNNNGVCDSGETNSNCPNDCPLVPNTQSSDNGGTQIPTHIVDVNNVNSGLLPEVYFGTLGFLSNTIQPIIILVFFIFFVLIILAIAFIIRKIGTKVGELGGR